MAHLIKSADGHLSVHTDGKLIKSCDCCVCSCPTDCTPCGVSVSRNATVSGFTNSCCTCFNDTISITNTGTGCSWNGFFPGDSPEFCGGEILLSCRTSPTSGVGDEWYLTLDLITLNLSESCSTELQEYEGTLLCDSATDGCGGGTYLMTVISADECTDSDNVIQVVVASLP